MMLLDVMLRQRVWSLHPVDEEHNLSFGERTSSVLEPQEFKQWLSLCSHHLAQVPWGFLQLKPEQTLHWCWGGEWALDEFSRSGSHLLVAAHWNSSCSISQSLCACLYLCWVGTLCEYVWYSSDTTSIFVACFFSCVYQSSWVRPLDLLMSILSQTARSMFWGTFHLSGGWSQELHKDFCFWNWILCDYVVALCWGTIRGALPNPACLCYYFQISVYSVINT